jgi:polyhydroxyalkanoate synthesis regulator phasin
MSALDKFFNNPLNWTFGAKTTIGENKLHYIKMEWVGEGEIPFEEAKQEFTQLRARIAELEAARDEAKKAIMTLCKEGIFTTQKGQTMLTKALDKFGGDA